MHEIAHPQVRKEVEGELKAGLLDSVGYSTPGCIAPSILPDSGSSLLGLSQVEHPIDASCLRHVHALAQLWTALTGQRMRSFRSGQTSPHFWTTCPQRVRNGNKKEFMKSNELSSPALQVSWVFYVNHVTYSGIP